MRNVEFNGPLNDYIEKYIDYKRSLGFKVGDTALYRLRDFDNYVKNNSTSTLTLDLIYNYINTRNVSSNTKSSIATIIRGLTKYLYKNEIISFYLPEKIYASKRKHKPYIFTDDEITKFFEAAKNFYSYCKFKNDVVMLCFVLLYCTGMRVGECLSIRFSDIDFNDKVITLYNTKGNFDRDVVVNDSIIDRIMYIKNQYQEMYVNNDYIFIKSNGSRHNSKSIYSIFKKIIFYSNIGQNGKYPRVHDFRFTYCCKAYQKIVNMENGQNYVPVLSAYVGHKDFKSTEYYLTLVSDLYPEIREKVEEYSSELIRELGDYDE